MPTAVPQTKWLCCKRALHTLEKIRVDDWKSAPCERALHTLKKSPYVYEENVLRANGCALKKVTTLLQKSPVYTPKEPCRRRTISPMLKSPAYSQKKPWVYEEKMPKLNGCASNKVTRLQKSPVYNPKEPCRRLNIKEPCMHSKEPYTYYSSVPRLLTALLVARGSTPMLQKSPICIKKKPYTPSKKPCIHSKRSVYVLQERARG